MYSAQAEATLKRAIANLKSPLAMHHLMLGLVKLFAGLRGEGAV